MKTSLLSACRETAPDLPRPEPASRAGNPRCWLSSTDATRFVSLPTGFGKSLIYQVPAMIVERPTIVISPLIALMTDQERALEKRGVPRCRDSQPATQMEIGCRKPKITPAPMNRHFIGRDPPPTSCGSSVDRWQVAGWLVIAGTLRKR